MKPGQRLRHVGAAVGTCLQAVKSALRRPAFDPLGQGETVQISAVLNGTASVESQHRAGHNGDSL